MNTSSEYKERLNFIEEYFSTIENAGAFAADQMVVREIANLKRLGYSSDDDLAEERMASVQLFSIEVSETIRAQMVVIIWSYFETLFSSAIRSITMYKDIDQSFQKNRSMSLVENWKKHFREVLQFDSHLSEDDWQNLADILHVRNFIAHSTHRPGSPPRGKQKEAVERLVGIKIVPDGVSISRAFLVSHLEFANRILAKLGGEHWLQSESFSLPEL